jgi:signal transduction histidine kinase
MNLKRRVTLALVSVVTLFVAAQGVLAYLSLDDQEDELADAFVLAEARALAQRATRGELRGPAGIAFLEAGTDLSAWLVDAAGNAMPQPLPAHLAGLADGPHRPGRPNRHLHVIVLPTAEGRLFVQYDAERNEAKVHDFGAYLLGLGALCIALGAALSWRVAAWLVGPIERLTARLSDWAPADGRGGISRSDPSGEEESRLLAAFDRVQDRFEQAIADEREFVANVSHEIRTPLAALRTDLEMLASTAGVTQAERLRRAVAAVDTMAGALDAARAMSRRRRAEPQTVDVARCVDDAWASVQSRAATEGVRLVNEVAPGRSVEADRHALLTILRNLMRNALEHATPTRCVVRLDARGIAVIDDGAGIAAADLPFVFERYYRGRRVDSTGQPTDGERGLGLAIARQLADLNGWTLTVGPAPQADPGFAQGTCFTLAFHRADDAASTKL